MMSNSIQRFCKPKVGGSIPSAGTVENQSLSHHNDPYFKDETDANLRETEVEPQAVNVTLSVSQAHTTVVASECDFVNTQQDMLPQRAKTMPRTWTFVFPSEDEIRDAASRGPRLRSEDVPHVIYFAQCFPFMKIGISRDLASRDFATSNPFPIYFRMVLAARKTSARFVERHLHRHFRPAHHRGEWFQLTTAEVRVIRRDAEKLIAMVDDVVDDQHDFWEMERAERRALLSMETEREGDRQFREELERKQYRTRMLNTKKLWKTP